MKISCTPISMAKTFKEQKEFTIRKYIEYCAKLGMDGVDVMDSVNYPWQWRDAKSELSEIPQTAADNGLQIAAYACGNNFTKKSDAEFNQQVANVKAGLNKAASIGAPLVRIFGGVKAHLPNGELSYPDAMSRVLQGIELCLPEAEKCGVVIALENHFCMPGLSWEIKSIVKHFSSPYLKVMFDCANFLSNNMDELEDPLRAFDQLKDDVVHIHYKDFALNTDPEAETRIRAAVAGEGIIPLRQLAAGFEANGYDGFFSLEYEAGAFTPESEGVPRSTEYIKSVRKVVEKLV
ncbi:sugar phosphate isomerase/epimerase [Lentisphaerota bacterium ZTH]|nr:sugar phosphate isomerase/epimerase [Lentisphaerota bacterium]WET06005.1 sugar phosphate isomerase/epimerase [Lentisphaerota bacterium ZTH]